MVQLSCTTVQADQQHNLSSFQMIHSKQLAIFCGCTDWFVSDLVKNPEDRFSHNDTQTIMQVCHVMKQRIANNPFR